MKTGEPVRRKLKIKKGDIALVIAGSDKGRRSKVLEVNVGLLKARLQGVRVQTHFDKKEGIQKKEGWIDYSNIRWVSSGAKTKTGAKATAKAKITAKTEAKAEAKTTAKTGGG